MTRYVALLRAVNVGGTGKLAMADLKRLCGEAGFARVETYIASGNVVFDSRASASKVKSLLEARLAQHAGKAIGVMLRTAEEMQAVLGANPFADAAGNLVYTFFLDTAPLTDALGRATGLSGERLALGTREIYAHFPRGMGQSKLRLPAAKTGTARNMNTVAALVAMAMRG